MGARATRQGAGRFGMVDARRRSQTYLRRRSGADVGDGDSPPRHRSVGAADQRRRALKKALLLACVLALTAGCRGSQPAPPPTAASQPDPMLQKLTTMTARFAPVDLTADISALPANERQALAKLVEAAKVFDTLFFRQVWSGNETMLLDLVHDSSDIGRARLHYFMLNKGPWSRLDHNEPFVAGAPAK